MDMSGMDGMTGMNHGTMTQTMAAAATTAMGDMDMSGGGGMDHGMDMGMGGCKVSMLWNWDTIDTCFISESWHVTSRGMFAGSCIGVVLLVIALEFLRRSVKEFDRYLIRQHVAAHQNRGSSGPSGGSCSGVDEVGAAGSIHSKDKEAQACAATASGPRRAGPCAIPPFRPTVLQQAIRALLHMVQFAVAYFVMLLAMYYNGYLIICIFIGAYLGSFIFHWESVNVGYVPVILLAPC